MAKAKRKTYTLEEWEAEGVRLFGEDRMNWRFMCPVCGFAATTRDYKDAGASAGAVAFSCIGRYRNAARNAFGGAGEGPCNYTGGGLIGLNPVTVKVPGTADTQYFDFAPLGGEEDT